MASTINYQNNIVTTVPNGGTVTLNTEKSYVESNIEVVDTTAIQSLTVTPSSSEQIFNGIIIGSLITTVNFSSKSTETISPSLTVGSTYYYEYMYGSENAFINGNPFMRNGTFTCNSTLTVVISDGFSASNTQVQGLNSNYDMYSVKFYSVTITDGYLPVTVTGDSNLISTNIKHGVSIFGVTGNYAGTVLIQDSQDTNGGTIRTITTDVPIYVEPLNITANGSYTPTTNHYYSTVNVNVAGGSGMLLQDKTEIIPTESSQTITADAGYGALSSVQINGISSTYVGSGITSRNSSSLTASGATVTVPAGYYASAATKTISSGIATGPSTISDSNATVSIGTNTLTLTKTVSVTPTISAGYISSGTATDSSVSLTASVTTKAAATIAPTTSDQTIAAGTYLTGTQTISGDANLVASNIKSGISIFGVTGSYTGTSTSVSLQEKTNITPSESSQTITADNGYDGLSSVQINAISSTYIGSGITARSSTDLTASGATVTVPAGYYASQATKSVTTMTLPTAASSSATSGYSSKATISQSTSAQYINIPAGYNSSGAYYTISAVPNGSATGPSSLSGSSATVTTGTNTITLTKTGVTTTPTVSAGYVSSATASTATVTLTASVTTKAAATITPTTTNQTISSDTYLTGTQTIAGDSNLVASNIISGKSIFGVSGSVVIQHYYTGSSTPSSSLGDDGDIYLKTT